MECNDTLEPIVIEHEPTYEEQVIDKMDDIIEALGSGCELKLFAIRPDAELVKSWNYDKLIVQDEGATIPAYTTSSVQMKAGGQLESVAIDIDTYDYFVCARLLTIPIYNVSTKGAGRQEYSYTVIAYELMNTPPIPSLVDSADKYTFMSPYVATYAQRSVNLYYSNATTLAVQASSLMGANQSFSSTPIPNAGNYTIQSPSMILRGGTPLSQTYFEAITDIRYQYVIELYRVRKGSMNIDGWEAEQQVDCVLEAVNSPTHKLA